MASLLTVAFGCPGDDSSGDDANTTNTTQNTTPGTTTDDTSGEPPAGTSTGEPPAGTSSGEPGTSSGEPADSSSGSDSGSSTGGMINPACEMFCNSYFAACGASDANDYGDPPGCVAACQGYDQETFDCKEYHASMADGPDSIHCSHANLDGGGVC